MHNTWEPFDRLIGQFNSLPLSLIKAKVSDHQGERFIAAKMYVIVWQKENTL